MLSKFISRLSHFLLISACLFTTAPLNAEALQHRITKLGDCVYAIEHPGHRHDGLFGGNTTVVIGTRQVFVVDSAFLRDKSRILLYRDLLESAVDQLNAKRIQTGPAMSRTLEEVK